MPPAARRRPHAEVFFDQLEVPVVVSEQNGGVGAFSQFELSHEGPKPDPPLNTQVILTKRRQRDKRKVGRIGVALRHGPFQSVYGRAR
jgi:hypothetical protein